MKFSIRDLRLVTAIVVKYSLVIVAAIGLSVSGAYAPFQLTSQRK